MQKRTQSTSAMTDSVFRCEIDFSHGLVEFWKIEEWIISEASMAAWGSEDFALDRSFGGEETDAVTRECEYATIAGVTMVGGNVSQPR